MSVRSRSDKTQSEVDMKRKVSIGHGSEKFSDISAIEQFVEGDMTMFANGSVI